MRTFLVNDTMFFDALIAAAAALYPERPGLVVQGSGP
jgi:hypothetical protein